jgi:hypothetical protein
MTAAPTHIAVFDDEPDITPLLAGSRGESFTGDVCIPAVGVR